MVELSKFVRCFSLYVSGLELSSLVGQTENTTMNDEAVFQTVPDNPVQKISSSKSICNLRQSSCSRQGKINKLHCHKE